MSRAACTSGRTGLGCPPGAVAAVAFPPFPAQWAAGRGGCIC